MTRKRVKKEPGQLALPPLPLLRGERTDPERAPTMETIKIRFDRGAGKAPKAGLRGHHSSFSTQDLHAE